MKKLSFLFILALTACCSSSERYVRSMSEKYYGANIEDIVKTYGIPFEMSLKGSKAVAVYDNQIHDDGLEGHSVLEREVPKERIVFYFRNGRVFDVR